MAVITLAEAKATLGITTTSKDAVLQPYVDGVTPVLEYLAGPIDVLTYTETYDGGSPQILLLHAPVTAVTSLIESSGSNYVRTLTAVDIFSGTSSDAYSYSIELDTGVVTRRAAGMAMSFPYGRRNVKATYTAGRATVPGNIKLAALELVRAWWQVGQQGNRPTFGDAPEMAFGTLPPDVRTRIHEILGSSIRLPGIG